MFPRAASSLAVVLNLLPRAKLKVLANCQFLDMDGRKVGEGKPVTVKADVKDTPAYAWQIPLARTRPGLYRVEIVFDGAPVWRTFIRITG